MAAATNQQVQQWANERTRVLSELVVLNVLNRLRLDVGTPFESVFLNLTDGGGSTFADNREDVPNKVSVNDMLAINAFAADLKTFIEGHGSFSVVQKAVVRTGA